MNEYLRQMCFDVIENLRAFEPPEGYYVAFSGGKDSCVILDLVKKSGVKYDAHFNFTSVDPPELVKFIKEHHPDVEIHRPEKTMFQLIEKKGFPSLWRRWCCALLKERGGTGRVVVTGIRKQESAKRAKRKSKEVSKTDKTKLFCHIIFDWKTKDVWGYIKSNNLPYCCLYDDGWERIGCLFCPMSKPKEYLMQKHKYPNVVKAYINSIQKCVDGKPSKHFGTDAQMFFDWWISKKSVDNYKGYLENMEIDL